MQKTSFDVLPQRVTPVLVLALQETSEKCFSFEGATWSPEMTAFVQSSLSAVEAPWAAIKVTMSLGEYVSVGSWISL